MSEILLTVYGLNKFLALLLGTEIVVGKSVNNLGVIKQFGLNNPLSSCSNISVHEV